jgi:hypothetical protein
VSSSPLCHSNEEGTCVIAEATVSSRMLSSPLEHLQSPLDNVSTTLATLDDYLINLHSHNERSTITQFFVLRGVKIPLSTSLFTAESSQSFSEESPKKIPTQQRSVRLQSKPRSYKTTATSQHLQHLNNATLS